MAICRSPNVMRSAARGSAAHKRPVKRRQPDHVAAQVVRLRPGVRRLQAANERPGHVLHVLQVLHAAVADVIRPADGQRLDRLGRLAGHAEVAADAVDRPRPQADARQAVVLEVDAGVALVAALEVAVMRGRRQLHVVGQRPGRVVLRRPEHGGGAGVDQPLHLAAGFAHRLEDGQRARGRSPWRRGSGWPGRSAPAGRPGGRRA